MRKAHDGAAVVCCVLAQVKQRDGIILETQQGNGHHIHATFIGYDQSIFTAPGGAVVKRTT